MLAALTKCLDKFFPKDRFFAPPIILDSDSDEDEKPREESSAFPHQTSFVVSSSQVELSLELNDLPLSLEDFPATPLQHLQVESVKNRNFAVKSTTNSASPSKSHRRPEKPQESIAEYKTKTSILKPASAYANPLSANRQIVSISYKEQIAPKAKFDPKMDAIKLNGIKEKIYAKVYLNGREKKEDHTKNVAFNDQQDLNNNSGSSDKIQHPRRKSCYVEERLPIVHKKLRQKTKKSYVEPSSDETTDTSDKEDFSEIPIQKSQSIRIFGKKKKLNNCNKTKKTFQQQK